MHHVRTGSLTLAATSGSLLVSGMAAAAVVLVCSCAAIYLFGARRRRHDRMAVRRTAIRRTI